MPQACGRGRLHADHAVCEPRRGTRTSSRRRTATRRRRPERRPTSKPLTIDLVHHPRVAEHDQAGDLLVAGPRRVRHDRPAVRRASCLQYPHRVVVRAIDADRPSRLRRRWRRRARRGIGGHVDARGAAGVARRARHGAAVIAFAGADHAFRPAAASSGQQRLDREPRAEQLEGVQAEAADSSLANSAPRPSCSASAGRCAQRRRRELRAGREKRTHLR